VKRPASVRCAGVAVGLAVGVGGCGLGVQAPDLFQLTRTGQGTPLRLLVNDSGTVSCDGGKARPLPDPLLLQARDLAITLDNDAKAKLRSAGPATVFTYKVRLQDGTLSFPDTAAARHSEFAQAELFAAQTAQQACGLSG
jgi:hypothetical protein